MNEFTTCLITWLKSPVICHKSERTCKLAGERKMEDKGEAGLAEGLEFKILQKCGNCISISNV